MRWGDVRDGRQLFQSLPSPTPAKKTNKTRSVYGDQAPAATRGLPPPWRWELRVLILDNSPREQTEHPCSLVPSPSDPGNRKVQKGGLRVQSPGSWGRKGGRRGRGGGAQEVPHRPPPAGKGARTESGTHADPAPEFSGGLCLQGRTGLPQLMIPVGVQMTLRPACTCLPCRAVPARWVVLPFPPHGLEGPAL